MMKILFANTRVARRFTRNGQLLLLVKGACLLAILLCFLFKCSTSTKSDYSFEIAPATSRVERDGFDISSARSLILDAPAQSNHSSSCATLPDGRVVVLWYGGTREGAKDVCIYGKTAFPEDLSAAPTVAICSREDVSRDLLRPVRKLGNPVVYSQGERLWMFVVSVSYGGWSGSSINYRYSDDKGKTWSKFRRLRTSPFFNLSALVRTPCVPRNDSGFILPVYCEFITKNSMALFFDKAGRMTGRSRILIDGNRESLQPSITPISSNVAFAFLRTVSGKVGFAECLDGGISWRARVSEEMENHNASVATLCLSSGRVFLIGNSEADRSRLSLYESKTNLLSSAGEKDDVWKLVCDLENEQGCEFSYPFLNQTANGSVYLTYTYKRRNIKFVDLSDCFYESNLQE